MKIKVIILFLFFLSKTIFVFWNTWEINTSQSNENITKNHSLSQKQREMILKKIEWKSQFFYSKLLEKTEEYIAKTKNEILRIKLEELREIINTKIIN